MATQEHEIGEIVTEYVREIFEVCKAKDDFCIQHVNTEISVIFGSTNRIIFNPRFGFKMDERYCTSRFKTLYREHYEKD